MNFVRDDLQRLRLPFALCVALIVIGAVCLLVSEHYLEAARTARAAAQAGRVAAQDRVSKVSEEERGIRENLVYYDRMRQRGMVGDQNRLDWIESIAKIKNDRKLFDIRYSIEAQKVLDYPGITVTGSTDFVVSRLKLEIMLLHEDDLLKFLSDLEAAGKSHVSVRRCTVIRLDRAAALSATALQPRLRAECQIDLITLKEAKPA